jgi:hypothetical protein
MTAMTALNFIMIPFCYGLGESEIYCQSLPTANDSPPLGGYRPACAGFAGLAVIFLTV